MIQLFRTNQPYVYVLLLLYTVLLRAGLLFFAAKASAPVPLNYSFAGLYFSNWLLKENPGFWLQAIDASLIFAEAIFFNYILTTNGLFNRQTFIPALMFITFSSCFGQWLAFNVETVARLFVLLSIYNLFALSRKDLSRENIFYTSLYLGLGCLFYFPVVVFLVVVLVGLFIRSYSIRDFVLIIFGFLFPFYTLGIVFYYHSKLKEYLVYLVQIFTPKTLLFDLSAFQLCFIIFMLIMAAYGFYKLRGDAEYKVIKKRRMYNLVLMYTSLIVIAAPFVLSGQLSFLKCLIIPCALFSARIFDRDTLKYYHQVLFAILIAGILFLQAAYFGIVHVKI